MSKLNLKDGDWVQLRNGDVVGPIRDRYNENDMWPWGEKCPKCTQALHDMCWRPDGKASKYNEEPPFENNDESPYDIVRVTHAPNPLDNIMEGISADEDLYDDGDLAHWIATPMKDLGTFEQFHEVVNRAQRVINYWRQRNQAHKINEEQKPYVGPTVITTEDIIDNMQRNNEKLLRLTGKP